MNFKSPRSAIRKRKIERGTSRGTINKNRRTVHLRLPKELDYQDGGILNKSWTCYTCSPLSQFRTDGTSLECYSQLLSAHLNTKYQKKHASGHQTHDDSLISRFSVVRGLAIHPYEPDAVRINIVSQGRKKPCEVYLISVDTSPDALTVLEPQSCSNKKSFLDDFSFFPLLLFSGPKKYYSVLISWLESNFNSYINPMKFSPIDLSWMMSMWTSLKYIPSEGKDPFLAALTWEIPVKGIGLEKIVYQIAPDSVSAIWNRLKFTQGDEMAMEDVDKFMSAITMHLTHLTKIKFDALKLVEISTQFVKVLKDGVIEVNSHAHVHTVFAHLCCLALERIFPFQFNLN